MFVKWFYSMAQEMMCSFEMNLFSIWCERKTKGKVASHTYLIRDISIGKLFTIKNIDSLVESGLTVHLGLAIKSATAISIILKYIESKKELTIIIIVTMFLFVHTEWTIIFDGLNGSLFGSKTSMWLAGLFLANRLGI